MANGSANPVLVVRDSMDEHIAGLREERDQCARRLLVLAQEIAVAESLRLIVPPVKEKEGKGP